MMLRRSLLGLLLAAVVASAASVLPATPGAALNSLPERLTNQEFWRLSGALSEDGGTFHSDNFVSNEGLFQTVIPDLVRRARPDGLYVGVGPEQNFTYMAATRPRMAFIVDIRRGNLHAHLLYKALFEMSGNRADFLARLFARPRPAGVGPSSTAEELFTALESSPPTKEIYEANLKAVTEWLTGRRGLPLSPDDLAGIDYVYRTAFYAAGPDLNYRLTGQGGFGRGGTPSYAQLMTMDDGEGRQWSYLASEPNFAFIKALHDRNLIVPVVGDFGGPKALRAVGDYARAHGAVISMFYLSNVEQYLRPLDKWSAFCANVAAMPLDDSSTFVRSVRGGRSSRQGPDIGFIRFASSLGKMRDETTRCAIGPAASIRDGVRP